jgi:Tol biopolymer transport system component
MNGADDLTRSLHEGTEDMPTKLPGAPELRRHAERGRRTRVLVGTAMVTLVALAVTIGVGASDPHATGPEPAPVGSPTAPSPTGTRGPEPALSPAIYFDALAVEGDALTDPITSINGQKDIYLTREGGPARQIIATKANEHCPRVSPEGDMLAYLEGRTVVVRALNPTGDPATTATRVKFDTRDLTCPQWSPDGRQLAVAITGYDAPDQIIEVRVIELDGENRLLAARRDQYMPLPWIAWSPDGDAIAFTTPDSIWVAPLDGGEPEMLWRGRAPQDPVFGPPLPGTTERLWWLATGELAIGAATDEEGHEAVHIVDPDSGRDHPLGDFPVDYPETWSWSPDGSRLVFSHSDGSERMFDRASGTTVSLRPRLDGREMHIWKLAWSADGHRLVGTADDGDRSTGGFALVSMDPDGSSVKVLTPWVMALYSEADPSWSPR